MMTAAVTHGSLQIVLGGWDLLWTFKRHLSIPLNQIATVAVAPSRIRPRGFRAPGAALPGVIYAGTWRRRGRKEFWNVRRSPDRWLVLDLVNSDYDRIVLELDDSLTLVAQIERARQL